MDFNIEHTFVVNRTAGVTTSLLVTLKAYDMEQVPDQTKTCKIDADGNTEDYVGPDYAAATVLGTPRTFTYIIPEDQQTDKEHKEPHVHANEIEYQQKSRMWSETFLAGQDYITCYSHLKSEVL